MGAAVNGRISNSSGFIWASVGPAQCPVKVNAVMVNTVTLPTRQDNLVPVEPSLGRSDSMILVGVVRSGFPMFGSHSASSGTTKMVTEQGSA